MKDLFEKYGLIYNSDNPESKENDVYAHKHYTIITRMGIQKIEKAAGIRCNFSPVAGACGKDVFTVHVRAYLPKERKDVAGNTFTSTNFGAPDYETFASASDLTSQNKYYAEMAEKRGRSRAVLTLAGLYELGAYGEDEADDFSNEVKNQKSQAAPRAVYKGS